MVAMARMITTFAPSDLHSNMFPCDTNGMKRDRWMQVARLTVLLEADLGGTAAIDARSKEVRDSPNVRGTYIYM